MQTLNQASSLLGKEISWYDTQGNVQSGIVDSISVLNGTPTAIVGDQMVYISDIFAISNPPES